MYHHDIITFCGSLMFSPPSHLAHARHDLTSQIISWYWFTSWPSCLISSPCLTSRLWFRSWHFLKSQPSWVGLASHHVHLASWVVKQQWPSIMVPYHTNSEWIVTFLTNTESAYMGWVWFPVLAEGIIPLTIYLWLLSSAKRAFGLFSQYMKYYTSHFFFKKRTVAIMVRVSKPSQHGYLKHQRKATAE